MMGAALDGVRVLDLGRVLSGPFCGRILADLGADVIKIEAETGDDGRHFGPFYDGESSYHRLLNRNKRGLTLDLKSDTGLQALRGLAARADVLIENFRPGVLSRLGIGPEALAEINPRLIVVSISGFGQDGPLSQMPAYDLIVQAMSGIMSVTGPDGGEPVRVGVSIGDMIPAQYAAIATFAALRQREMTGVGQHIDIAMFDALVSMLESVAMRALMTDDVVEPTGSHHAISAPFGTFATNDKPVAIAIANDSLFVRFAQAAGHPEWADDPRFVTDDVRGRHRDELREAIEGWLSTFTRDDAIALLGAAGIPCAPVLGVREALAHPHAAARGLVRTEADGFRTLANAFHLAGMRSTDDPAPRLGQHNDLLAKLLAEPVRTGEGHHGHAFR